MAENISLKRGKRAGNMLLAEMLVYLALYCLVDSDLSDLGIAGLIVALIGGGIGVLFSLILVMPLRNDNLKGVRGVYIFLGCISLVGLYFSLKSDSVLDKTIGVLSAAAMALVIIALYKPGDAGKNYCYFAAFLSLISALASIESDEFALHDFINSMLHTIYIVFLGLYIESKGKSLEQQPITEDASESPSEEQIDNPKTDYDELIKLKELMDKGVITPEEYDAKKKQILGL